MEFGPPTENSKPYDEGGEQRPHTSEQAFGGTTPEDTTITPDVSSALNHELPEVPPADDGEPAASAADSGERTIRLRGKGRRSGYSIEITSTGGGQAFVGKNMEAVDEQGKPLANLPEGVTRVGRGTRIHRGEDGKVEVIKGTDAVNSLQAALRGLTRRFRDR